MSKPTSYGHSGTSFVRLLINNASINMVIEVNKRFARIITQKKPIMTTSFLTAQNISRL